MHKSGKSSVSIDRSHYGKYQDNRYDKRLKGYRHNQEYGQNSKDGNEV